jgi:sulfur transfer protein SufE
MKTSRNSTCTALAIEQNLMRQRDGGIKAIGMAMQRNGMLALLLIGDSLMAP